MQKEKSNIVYMLQLSIYDDSIGNNHDVLVGEWHYNDVFTSIEKAVKVGKKELLRKLKELKSQIFKDAKIDEIIESTVTSYEFYVYEFDPDVKRSRVMPQTKWDDYAWWDFDYKGKLRSREESKTYKKDGEMEVSFREVNPGDEKEEAGSKFKAGDFVMIDSRWLLDDNNLVYVIHDCPGKKSEWAEKHPHRNKEWENRYSVNSIDNNGLFVSTYSHEMNIRLYEGIVPPDHPLQWLRMFITGEVDIDYDVWVDIHDRKIVFDCSYSKKSWHDIPKLYEQFTKVSSGQQNDMIYKILPRWKATHYTEKTEAPDTAIISIVDPESSENLFNDQKWIKGILRLEFDDVEGNESVDRERYIHMSEEQAQQIVDFAYKHYNDVKRFIIHCEAGASRSAAVAVALCEHFEKHDNNIWNDKRYHPNKYVYSLVKAAFEKCKEAR